MRRFLLPKALDLAASLLFQPAEGAAMMPDRLDLNLNGILAPVVALCDLLDELSHLICGRSFGLDPAHLPAMDPMMALCLVHGGDGIFGILLTISISQIEVICIIKAVANGPMVIGHGLYQIIFGFQFLE
jgi:hypothetical protein